MPATLSRRPRRAHAALIALVALLPAALAPAQDRWQVRALGNGPGRQVTSISHVGEGAAHQPPATRLLARAEAGQARVELHADDASAARLRAPGVDFSREIELAGSWLRRLAPPSLPRTSITLRLVSPGIVLRQQHRRSGAGETMVELWMPLPADPRSLSAQVGQSLAVALHEASHALPTTHASARGDDEYRASLVESCYLIDTLRPGDELRLPQPAPPVPGEYFVHAQSRAAMARVLGDLARVAGRTRLAWHDRFEIQRLGSWCRERLGMTGPEAGTGETRLPSSLPR